LNGAQLRDPAVADDDVRMASGVARSGEMSVTFSMTVPSSMIRSARGAT
jgi:hypothetical protein